MLNNINITAGQTLEYFEPGDFFRIMESAGPLTLIFYRQGAEVARAEGVSEGYAERFRGEGFDRYRITSATTQAIQFVSRLGADVAYDKPPTGAISGTVALDAPTLAALETINVGNFPANPANQGTFTSAQKTVTSSSGQLLASNANRRYLMVQNNDATGIVYVNVAGAAATATNSVRLLPGAALEITGFVPSGAINAIGSIASNANVVAVEG